MTLTLGPILGSAGIDPSSALAMRHAYVTEHEDSGLIGINAHSTDSQILEYTRRQSPHPRYFPTDPPPTWLVFTRERTDHARLWAVLQNRGEVSNDGNLRTFDLEVTDQLLDLRNRLVISWRAPRSWRLHGTTAANYPVVEIADRDWCTDR